MGDELCDLEEALEEYPQFAARVASPGVWLSGTIRPIDELSDSALVLLSYPLNRALSVKAWAWWDCGIWVGPRHTNYGDASICAFEQTDHTWTRRDPLLLFLDLTSGWIVRHLHLRYVGFWPGRQRLHTVLERLREHRPGELCGCDSGRLYERCHGPKDLTVPPSWALDEFRAHFRDPLRQPPTTSAAMEAAAHVPPGMGSAPRRPTMEGVVGV